MKVLVIGDSCVDQFQYGSVTRLSQEAPVPILNPTIKTENEGMAGNVVANLKALGGELEITFITNISKPYKIRYVDEKFNHQILRVDINDHIGEKFVFDKVDFSPYQCLVVSDYNKGYLSENDIFRMAKKCPVTFLDTKKPISTFCLGYTFIKVNELEWNESVKLGVKGVGSWGNLIVTKGSKGCDYKGVNYPTEPVSLPSVSGAGDTFLAGLVYKYLLTKDIQQSIIFANQCATKVVTRKGVTTV